MIKNDKSRNFIKLQVKHILKLLVNDARTSESFSVKGGKVLWKEFTESISKTTAEDGAKEFFVYSSVIN